MSVEISGASVRSRDALEQSQRLLDQMENAQADYEANLRHSKQALARSERLLARLRDILFQEGAHRADKAL
jgi:hypothetical protein